MWKRKITFLLVFVLLLSNKRVVNANDVTTIVEYDLKKGGAQAFYLLDEDANIEIITIEEVQKNSRVANNTYKISYETTHWIAGFYVVIFNNRISSAYSPFHSCSSGDIKSPMLILETTTKATYTFIYKLTIRLYDTGVIASVKNDKLIVSKR